METQMWRWTLMVAVLGCGHGGAPGATADVASLVGAWTEPVTVPVFSYTDAAACAADGGAWRDDACQVDAANTVTIGPDGALSVSILGTNAHTCEFDGALRAAGGAWIADGEAGCRVTVNLRDGALSLENNGRCEAYCGARAFLEVRAARR